MQTAPSSDHGIATRNRRFDFIDSARGIAALAVIAEHLYEARSPWFYTFSQTGFSLGAFGVTLFFLVSGFIIPVSIEKAGLKRFWIARVFRLYPLYWLSLGLVAASVIPD